MNQLDKTRLTVKAMVFIAVGLGLNGCSKSTADKIVGTWKPEVGLAIFQLTFNKDGTCTFAAENGKYRVDGNNLIITTTDVMSGKPSDNTATIVTLDDKKLTLKMPDFGGTPAGEQTFIRVE